MPRIRSIKPDFWDDEKLAKMSLQANLLFIGMWNFADDNGVIRASAGWIKAQIFPHRGQIRVNAVQKWLSECKQHTLVIPFEFNNEAYLLIKNFHRHQRIDRPQPSKVPLSTLQKILDEFDESSTSDRRSFAAGEGRDRIGRDGMGSEFVESSKKIKIISKENFKPFQDKFLVDELLKENVAKKSGLNPEITITDFFEEQISTEKNWPNETDLRRHLLNWSAKQKYNGPKKSNRTNQNSAAIIQPGKQYGSLGKRRTDS